MRRGRPWALAAGLALGASVALAQSPADAVVQQLRAQGYVEFEVSRTLLGRVRVVATASDGSQREIVFIPATGEILRDYSAEADGSVTPRILDRSEGGTGTPAASLPSGSGGNDGASQPVGDDGNRGHGNDEDGFDNDNPGRGHGSDGVPGGGNPDHPAGQSGGSPSRGGGTEAD